MKTSVLLPAILGACTALAAAQGTYVYDQQPVREGASGIAFFTSTNQPFGQSFTPSLGGVGFARFSFYDPSPNDGLGASFHVELRSGSLTGVPRGATPSVYLPDNFGHNGTSTYVSFLFPDEVPVTPGTQYFFQIVKAPGPEWLVEYNHWPYDGGNAYLKGQASTWNLWFGEGIIVPEPGTGAVLGLGLALLAWVRRSRAS